MALRDHRPLLLALPVALALLSVSGVSTASRMNSPRTSETQVSAKQLESGSRRILAPTSTSRATTIRAAAVSCPTSGYAYEPVHWASASNIPVYINSNGPDSSFVTPIREGLLRWNNDPNSNIGFRYAGTTALTKPVRDGINTIYWQPLGKKSNVLAITQYWGDGTGLITDFDTVINSSYSWSTSPTKGRFDLVSLMVHEAGHALGLGHVSCSNSVMQPVLPTNTVRRALGPGDIAAVSRLYPNATQPPSSTTPPPTFYQYSVYHTCANGHCGLNVRSGPGYTNYGVTRGLSDGNIVNVTCQTRGESVSGIDGSSTNVWDRLVEGDYVSDFYVSTPGATGSFSPPIPQC